jgi:hypothetical protein
VTFGLFPNRLACHRDLAVLFLLAH